MSIGLLEAVNAAAAISMGVGFGVTEAGGTTSGFVDDDPACGTGAIAPTSATAAAESAPRDLGFRASFGLAAAFEICPVVPAPTLKEAFDPTGAVADADDDDPAPDDATLDVETADTAALDEPTPALAADLPAADCERE